MKMKKILSIALALVLAIGMLAGCGGGGQQVDISSFEDTDETLAISWLGYPGLAGCEEGLPSELLLEDKFNVEITPIFAEYNGYSDKKNALLQSGDIPDLVYEMDPMYHFADARDEYFLEVPYAAIEKYAPSIYADINDRAPAAWAYSYYDGKNYGMPNLNNSHMITTVSIYRKDWLEKVGMEVPTTLDEMHDVLLAFVNDDPDGNGKNDTFGLVPTSSSYSYFFPEIFGAYGVLPFDWEEVDGEIVYGGLRPEVEDALQVLADWYKEGIVYPAFVELDKSAQTLFKENKAGYYCQGGYQDETSATSLISTTRQNAPEAEIAYATVVKGPDGKSGVRAWGDPAHSIGFGANDENSGKKATRILKMLEAMYTDDDLMTEVRMGKEGVAYEWVDKETTKAKNAYVATADYADAAQKRLAGYEFGFAGGTFWSPIAPKKELFESAFSKSYADFVEKYNGTTTMMTDVFYKVDIVPSAPAYLTDIHNAQQALIAQIIKGEKPADQYVEEFTKIWEASGGPVLLSEAQEQQSILEDIYSQIGLN